MKDQKIPSLFFALIVCMGFSFWEIPWYADTLRQLLLVNVAFDNNIFLGSVQASSSHLFDEAMKVEPKKIVEKSVQPPLSPPLPQENKDAAIDAPSAVAITIGSGDDAIFEKDGEKELPIASLTKLMTSLVVLENYNLDQKITVSQAAMDQIGEQGDLQLGQVLSVKNLLYITLIESSNRASYAIAEAMGQDAFIAAMNARASQLGLANTHFADSTGLNSASYSTAKDIATLSKYLFLNYPLFREIISLKEFNLYLDDGSLHHTLVNTNKLLGEISGVIGGKTGWTQIAKGCIMVIQESSQKGEYVVYVVLGAEDRFLEMKKMMGLVHSLHPEL